jgi:hypothetical protein
MIDLTLETLVSLGERATTASVAITNAEVILHEFEYYCPNDLADEKERLVFIIEQAVYQLTGKFVTISID